MCHKYKPFICWTQFGLEIAHVGVKKSLFGAFVIVSKLKGERPIVPRVGILQAHVFITVINKESHLTFNFTLSLHVSALIVVHFEPLLAA